KAKFHQTSFHDWTRKELIPFLSENNDDDDEVLLAMAEELGVFIPYVGGVEHANRLAAGEWFTARVSACGLFHIAYPSAPDTLKTELRSIYSQLCSDDMPMVRRAAATNLGKFAATIGSAHLKTDIMSMFDDLTQDDQDSVRLLAVEGCAALGKLLEPQDCVAHILPVIVNFSQVILSVKHIGFYPNDPWKSYTYEMLNIGTFVTEQDKSWRVRYMVANQLYELCEAVGPEPTRSALASVIMGMAPVLGKDATIEHLLPIFLSLLKDEFPDVRLNIISKLDQVNQVIGIDLLSQSLLPAIVELAEDRHWRVRLAIIEYIPLLASQLGVGFFDDKLGALCMQWLQDKVHSIRDAAANNLKRLAEEFGPEWAMQHIVPQVLEMINNPHYLYSMTILRAVSLLAPVMGSEITCSKLLPVVITASKDRQVLTVVENMIRPGLVELSEDPDVDVRFFANQALQSIDNVMMSS
ncbi:hypothetical protein HID58_086659, partial [Brassica napus]